DRTQPRERPRGQLLARHLRYRHAAQVRRVDLDLLRGLAPIPRDRAKVVEATERPGEIRIGRVEGKGGLEIDLRAGLQTQHTRERELKVRNPGGAPRCEVVGRGI